jgi:DNA-binding NarL/FixJ family response regulator
MIRISIIEDDRLTREGFLKLLQKAPDIICVGTYGSAEDAEIEIPKIMPDIVLADINLPKKSGIDCVAKLKRTHPQIQFLMLTTYDDSEMIFKSLRAGANGYLLKRALAPQLLEAIRDVHRGGSPMSMQIARRVVSHFHEITKSVTDVDKLTKRENEILGLLSKGLPYKQIADRLDISSSTVHNHLHAIYGKLHVQSRTEAVVRFLGK